MDLAAFMALRCAAVGQGRPHLALRRQTALAARAKRQGSDQESKDREATLRRRAQTISHNRKAATRRDGELVVDGQRRKDKGSGAWRRWTAAALPVYIHPCEGRVQAHESDPELQYHLRRPCVVAGAGCARWGSMPDFNVGIMV